MTPWKARRIVLVVLQTIALAALARNCGAQQTNSGPAPAAFPKDVYPDSGFRLRPLKREELDELGQKMFDVSAGPDSRSLEGLRGPFGIWLNSPQLAQRERELNQFLRYESGLSGHVRELAILVTAREFDSQFEWSAHESVALKEGVDRKTIDAVKNRKSSAGFPEQDAVIIQLGRQMFGQKKVAPATFALALKIFGARELVNLITLMTNYSSTAAVLSAFDMQLPAGRKRLLPMP